MSPIWLDRWADSGWYDRQEALEETTSTVGFYENHNPLLAGGTAGELPRGGAPICRGEDPARDVSPASSLDEAA